MAAPNIYQTIMNAESGGKNVKNYMYDSTHTASGYFQITNSTWKTTEAGRDSGVTNAMDAPYATQQAAAGELIKRNGLKDWAPYDHINSNVASYDQTPLSGPNGSPTTGSSPGYDQPTTGHSDASTSTYTKNSDGSYTQTAANGTSKAIAATTPIAIATGADEQSEAAKAAAKTTADASTANTKTAVGAAQGIWQSFFTGGGDLLGRIGFVVVGLVLLAGGLWIIASEESAGAIPSPAKTFRKARKLALRAV